MRRGLVSLAGICRMSRKIQLFVQFEADGLSHFARDFDIVVDAAEKF